MGRVAAVVVVATVIACGSALRAAPIRVQQAEDARPSVGVAFGGGGARGFAHVGVIRWFEDHQIPIDLVAGASMGGLVGGGYASGMSSIDAGRMPPEAPPGR